MMRTVGTQQSGARRFRRLIYTTSAILLISIVLVVFVFNNFLATYKANIIDESAIHLTEIIYQTKLYMEEKIHNDWQIMRSIQNSIAAYSQSDITDIFTLLQNERDIWGIADILVYAENGYCVSSDTRVYPNDDSSDVIYNARKHGKVMTIIQSTIIYTMPVESKLTLNGYPIVAVSVMQELDSFIDNMNFTSFDGTAYIYLAQQNGAIISRSTHKKTSNAYNVLALLNAEAHTCLTHKDHTMQEAFSDSNPCTFLMRSEGGDEYAVTVPIETQGVSLWLIYIVPEPVVNRTMNGFTRYVLSLTVLFIALFAMIAMCTFIFLYRLRKRAFDSALISRDRMFDLLVANTSNAFAMLTTKSREPIYISSNASNIIGDKVLWIEHTDGEYLMHTTSGADNESTRQINQDLVGWDGASEFVSSFVPYRAGGFTRYYVLRLYPVQGEGDEFIAIAQDVTREREREAALKDALVMADSANQAKTRFLANMSHDIRTPMNAIVNMVEFARESVGDTDKQTEYLKTIEDSAHHLLQLINDILDMSRIESGQTVIANDPFVLGDCLDNICEIVAPLCEQKELTFTTEFNGTQNARLIGDSLKLAQILINLLNNAAKFTPKGGNVSFTVTEMHSLQSGIASMRFSVKDSGIGIRSEDTQRIFEPFARVDDHTVKHTEGTGLGLSICQNYAAAMGGTINCISDPGVGSEFVVELPFERDIAREADIEVRAGSANISFTNKRALLCEDNDVNQKIAKMILERMGFAVDCASDGGESVERFVSSAPDTYDVIYMDVQMPVMNGYEATIAIRESSHAQAKTIPIIAMTANVFTEDVERARAAGMNEHIGKPIIINELKLATARVITGR